MAYQSVIYWNDMATTHAVTTPSVTAVTPHTVTNSFKTEDVKTM